MDISTRLNGLRALTKRDLAGSALCFSFDTGSSNLVVLLKAKLSFVTN